MPRSRVSVEDVAMVFDLPFAESHFEDFYERLDGLFFIGPLGPDGDDRSHLRRERHHAEHALGINLIAILDEPDFRAEFRRRLDNHGRRPGMHSQGIGDGHAFFSHGRGGQQG